MKTAFGAMRAIRAIDAIGYAGNGGTNAIVIPILPVIARFPDSPDCPVVPCNNHAEYSLTCLPFFLSLWWCSGWPASILASGRLQMANSSPSK